MNFIERFETACRRQRSHLCVGLDPDFIRIRKLYRSEIIAALRARPLNLSVLGTGDEPVPSHVRLEPEHLADEPEIAKDIVCEIVARATAPFAAVYKPNAAFFELEVSGSGGIPALVREMQSEHLVVYDAKRGDIGSTSEQYARAIFEVGHYDAVTVNPLMGYDAVEPFLRYPDRGVFLLCLTSNPGAEDFLLKHDLYKRIAEKAVQWNRHGNIGLVVGATRPEHAAEVRAIAPELPLLIPGVGAQGGSLEETLDAINARSNPRFVVNASRSIMFPEVADERGNLLEAVIAAARDLRDRIAKFLDGAQ